MRREREHHLPGGGGVGDARPAHARDRADARPREDEVDRHRVGVTRHRERRRLARLVGQRVEVRAGGRAQVDAAERVAREPQHLGADPVAAGLGPVLDIARGHQRGQDPRHGRGVDPGHARELVRAGVAADLGEGVEHAQCALDRCQPPRGGSTGRRHA
jgi:hypothetical protein